MFSKILGRSVIGMAIGAAIIPMTASAQIAELRLGISQFDEEILNLDGETIDEDSPSGFLRADESSIAISGEILFEEPEFLKWALSPQPYINGTLNLEGNTSFGGAGLLWRQSVGKKFYGDFAAGLVGHTGTRVIEERAELTALGDQALVFIENGEDVPPELTQLGTETVTTLIERDANEIEFGSRVLFRLQGAVGYNVNDDWSGEVYIEHLTNGGVFGDNNINERVNNIGIRAARKF